MVDFTKLSLLRKIEKKKEGRKERREEGKKGEGRKKEEKRKGKGLL